MKKLILSGILCTLSFVAMQAIDLTAKEKNDLALVLYQLLGGALTSKVNLEGKAKELFKETEAEYRKKWQEIDRFKEESDRAADRLTGVEASLAQTANEYEYDVRVREAHDFLNEKIKALRNQN